MDLSIVIVNWNTQDLLDQCLHSVYQHPPRNSFEIWVVDNASTDGSVRMVEQQYPQVRLIKSAENLGFARGNNLALEKCQGNYVFLLNPDTEVHPAAIDILIEFLEAYPQAGVAGSTLLYADGSLQTSSYPFPTLTREFWRLLHLDRWHAYGVYDQHHWDRCQPRKVDVVQGAALLVRKAVLVQVGYFDPDYFMYTEEVDLCYRIHKAGWDLFWVPQSEIVHYEGQSTKQVPVEMFLQLNKTKLRFIRKHHGKIAGAIYKLILGLTALPRILFASDANPKKAEITRNYRELLRSLAEM
ncbi:MAG TPA: glycosyltransferase family 2 protein [Chloroflexi bacterium]|nr:glycosyltransferase family 2 protein [Chloroflexota bacterium]HBY06506.1 glycosyltransferase family 2 protein [Chloroflexota bacterium]